MNKESPRSPIDARAIREWEIDRRRRKERVYCVKETPSF